jgi:hypothetical protein
MLYGKAVSATCRVEYDTYIDDFIHIQTVLGDPRLVLCGKLQQIA